MPEGPEVQRAADTLHEVLAGKPIEELAARTKAAKAWLKEHPGAFLGQTVERVWAHGKHLVGSVEGDLFFQSHFLMWGRWFVTTPDAPEVAERDRRERARILVPGAAALLYSAPKFNVGRGDPYEMLPPLARLGPDVLPGEGSFDTEAFFERLDRQPDRAIGAALLDQSILAGLGNYLRAEILFLCRIDPWRAVQDLEAEERECLAREIPRISQRAYEDEGRTVPEDVQAHMASEPLFVYNEAKPWNTKHWVFRRTNLPCVRCGDTVRQKTPGPRARQLTSTKKRRVSSIFVLRARARPSNLLHPSHARRRKPPSLMLDSAPFSAFAGVCEAIAATTKRNEKADQLGAFFERLSDADLRRAARYSAGRPFPLHDERIVNVGMAALLDAVGRVAGMPREALRPRLVKLGDPGEVAEEALAEQPSGAYTLEHIEGVLAELAATRGTKAKTNRLAQVLEDLGAQEAKYLVKLLSGDLRIGLREGGVESTLARMTGYKVAAVQRAHMLTGDLGQTALLARHDQLEDARMQLFHPLKFMLATAADSPDEVARQIDGRFAIEDKYDGIRAQTHIGPDPGGEGIHGVGLDGSRVALFSRTLDGIVGAFPDLVEPLVALLRRAPEGLILDGEIVPVDKAAVRPFQALQRRLGRKKPSAAILKEVPVAFVVYDALFFDGTVVLDEAYETRQKRLDALSLPDADTEGPVRRSTVRFLEGVEKLDEAFDAARERGNEGLMVKRPASPYKPGRRGRDWLKLKKALATLDCVVTAVEVGSGKRRHLLSDFTFAVRAAPDDATLLNVGKAYSGLTDAELAALTDWFREHTLQTFAHGRVRLVEPEVVIEVAFDRVQPSKRHKSGYALRFPRIVRLREDKPAEEIDTLDAVQALAEGS